MKSKKTGVATNIIINVRLAKYKSKKEQSIKKGKNCNKCNNFYKRNSWCNKYSFKVSTIELGKNCKGYSV